MAKVDPADLIGAREIASRLGMKGPQVVHLWRSRHPDFPKPLTELDMGLIWSWSEVEAWARKTGRLRE